MSLLPYNSKLINGEYVVISYHNNGWVYLITLVLKTTGAPLGLLKIEPSHHQ